ncbi:hypothetical protein [Nocardioides euryhalodurans]|uniref:Uncharacterized protein n=1 Tax=Nocardioides euryhalodurans TaxID=2518370 RepID=A0A4P7GJE6_9ACTN|nr:hypothetical protein [Nocardioides euryhalodurans]QBR91879.1 hypothetical protein EXE57_06010 [Nocardioides euryhalodurans]
MRTELAALLRQHRIMRRLAEDSSAERASAGRQILRFRQTVLVWCAQAIGVARPLTFPNVPQKPADPFRAASDHGAAVAELARALGAARDQATTRPASSADLTTPNSNNVVEHWRLAARAAALAEHDTAPDQAIHLTAAQARTIAGDVAAISEALVVLDRRYRNTPDWESIAGCDRLGWAALATALDVSLGQPDYTVDQTGWRPRTKPIGGPAKPGVLGVLQAEHNLLVRLASFPDAMNLRLVVDSQRLLSAGLVPYAERIDPNLAGQWGARAETYSRIQRELRNIGGRLGNGTAAAGEAANAVGRLRALHPDTVIEPRMLRGFQTLFHRVDSRIMDILESGVERGAFVQRVTVPRLVSGDGRLVHPVRERFVPVARAADLEVIQTAREHLRPPDEPTVSSAGTSRADLHAALVHRPPAKASRRDTPRL